MSVSQSRTLIFRRWKWQNWEYCDGCASILGEAKFKMKISRQSESDLDARQNVESEIEMVRKCSKDSAMWEIGYGWIKREKGRPKKYIGERTI